MITRRFLGLFAGIVLTPSLAVAQHDMAARETSGRLPTVSGQAAFAALADVVRVLKADSTTDWSKVDLEAVRQHLIDMDDVTLRSSVQRRQVAGGVELDVTGSGRAAAAIKRVLSMHSAMLDQSSDYRASASPISGGMRLRVTARDAGNDRAVAQIRGLGFAGLLTEGDHHARHHLMLARGEAHPHGG
jgi:hypothetical protein